MNDIEIDRGNALFIMPGVQVVFTGAYQLYVEGNLIAEGNSGNMVEFFSDPESRGEIYFEYTGDLGNNRLDYCKIDNMRIESYESSVSIQNSVISGSDTDIEEGNYTTWISNNTFRHCNDPIKIRSKFNITYVMDNEFDNCTAQIRGREATEMYCMFWNNTVHRNSGSGAVFEGWVDSRDNIFYNNSHGVEINDAYGHVNMNYDLIYNNSVGVYVQDIHEENSIAHNTITRNKVGMMINDLVGNYSDNNIYENSEHSVKLIVRGHMGESILMPNNWWGTDDVYEINDYIHDYYDDIDLPRVVFTPIQDAFVCTAPSLEPLADSDCDGTIDDFELLGYIELWVNGRVGDFDLLDAISRWTGG